MGRGRKRKKMRRMSNSSYCGVKGIDHSLFHCISMLILRWRLVTIIVILHFLNCISCGDFAKGLVQNSLLIYCTYTTLGTIRLRSTSSESLISYSVTMFFPLSLLIFTFVSSSQWPNTPSKATRLDLELEISHHSSA